MFLDRWIEYYGGQLGFENLHVFLDGHDQPLPARHADVNIHQIEHVPMSREAGDRHRAKMVSDHAATLFIENDAVIAVDVDEFLIPDPDHYRDLKDFIDRADSTHATLSGLGLDVAQNTSKEPVLEPDQPFLGQRRFAQVSTRYTKPSLAFKPVTWGSGFHRIKGRSFHIAPHLYLYHFGMIDQEGAQSRIHDADRLSTGWKGHMNRRQKLFDLIATLPAQDFDTAIPKTRRLQSVCRQLQAWNKPAMLNRKLVVEIPDRFFGIV